MNAQIERDLKKAYVHRSANVTDCSCCSKMPARGGNAPGFFVTSGNHIPQPKIK